MLRNLFCVLILLMPAGFLFAGTIIVKNAEELKMADSQAKPGDIIILQNGNWTDMTLEMNSHGTAAQPITFKAQTAGKVIINGKSSLKIGGSYLVIQGLYFRDGFAGDQPVINFRSHKERIANHCRVTECVINDFNNPKRMDENYWVAFYGKNNRLDHCSFVDKKNMGVLLAVILDDERSRENFHSIDHNYFGRRQPLASNGGEIIRVGVSQHCQFNSNTQITDNLFEECDGEAEIISIKSGANIIRNNVIKESQGSVVLRHGDNNTVENNLFFGNNKEATGGVRVINKGQWVVNNFFYACRGRAFRSPLTIMNGIPNSPAHRYVQVTDAVIANNSFYNCSPISLCEGSDTERTLPPANVMLLNNIFYNTTDTAIYRAFDDISGIRFANNVVNKKMNQSMPVGISINKPALQTIDRMVLPVALPSKAVPDSLQQVARRRIKKDLPARTGFLDAALLKKIQVAATKSGASWFGKNQNKTAVKAATIKCPTADEIYAAIEKKTPVVLQLTGDDYIFHKPLMIESNVVIRTDQARFISMHTVPRMLTLFIIGENSRLVLENLKIDGSDMKATHFISSDSDGRPGHYALVMNKCDLRYFNRDYGCEDLFYAFKSTIADSIVIENTSVEGNRVNGFILNSERDNKGYYNAEKIRINKNIFSYLQGIILDVYRGGNDESTLGPDLQMSDNAFNNCNTITDEPFIRLTGVQQTRLFFNSFVDCNTGKILLEYKDTVRANHQLIRNMIMQSGSLQTNTFVNSEKNTIQ